MFSADKLPSLQQHSRSSELALPLLRQDSDQDATTDEDEGKEQEMVLNWRPNTDSFSFYLQVWTPEHSVRWRQETVSFIDLPLRDPPFSTQHPLWFTKGGPFGTNDACLTVRISKTLWFSLIWKLSQDGERPSSKTLEKKLYMKYIWIRFFSFAARFAILF